jgi:hypothetical protein
MSNKNTDIRDSESEIISDESISEDSGSEDDKK